jgi:hypothetical protein
MATETVTEAAIEVVADELENAAFITRRLDGKMIGSVLTGIGIGVAVGFYFGYRYSKKKLRADIYAEAEEEINMMREHYAQKHIALKSEKKPSAASLVKDLGYISDQPDTNGNETEIRLLRPPVPISPSNLISGGNIVVPPPEETSTEKDSMDGWDYEAEISQRDRKVIYVIHADEFDLNEKNYSQTDCTYFDIDDVLVLEEDEVTPLHNRENLIGEEALELFGHGSGDTDLVYVRNDNLEMEYAIHRIFKSWEEEVLGHDPDDSSD